MSDYSSRIARLIQAHPLDIDENVVIQGRAPASASSEFLTNKEQGDWAEQLVLSSINAASSDYVALQYGRSDSISAGDPGFAEFYAHYQEELNLIGKRPDILIFKRGDTPSDGLLDFENNALISKAVAAIEVRSSSFLSQKYAQYMERRIQEAEAACMALTQEILQEPYRGILQKKNPDLFSLLLNASPSTFRELDFRPTTWSSSPDLRFISSCLKKIKEHIRILHKRDFLSITPKVEDLALVNRWIQRYNVPHYYLQVFFDRGYILSFERILEISSTPDLEDMVFSVEKDVKNQGKTTVKINIDEASPIIGRIDMPSHFSALKELDRGRLLFYVKFSGGQGFLDLGILNSILK
ncbi:MAG: AccI family restriction endonuclease [Victivallales bacterium]|nr:AccI family restriction endonuclease [Victivallales bacterium]